MKNKLYVIDNFDINNFNLIKNVIEFFIKKYPDIIIKIDDEMTGWEEVVTKNKLYKQVKAKTKKYTGLDKINLEIKNQLLIQIVFHEYNAFLDIDNTTKDEFEKELNLRLVEYNSNNN
jgi:hypothetical protein